MADGELEEFLEGMAARAAGRRFSPKPAVTKEADRLRQTLADDDWVYGPAGSKNIPIFGAAACGRFEDIAKVCEVERTQGLWGLEHGAPGLYYYEVLAAKLLAYRDLPSSHPLRETVRQNIRAALAWDALIALPVGRLQDEVVIAGRKVKATPGLEGGVTVAISGNRWTPEGGRNRDITSDDSHSAILAWALDWEGRVNRAPKQVKGTMAGLLGVKRYAESTKPELWGLTAEERETLKATVRGDAAAARTVAERYLWGTKPARLPKHPDPWNFRLRRTSEGVESVFFGPWPNPNKPARSVTQVTKDGAWLGLQPSSNKTKPAEGYRVEIREGRIYVSSAQSRGEHFLPELGGDLLWEVSIVGQGIKFTPGRR